MKWSELFDKWSLSGLKVKAAFVEMDFMPNDVDKNAAWEMYVEMQTRVITQELGNEDGDESTALTSINQEIRPFTAKWHRLSMSKAFEDPQQCKLFRKELKELQSILVGYAKTLEEMVGIEGLHKKS